MTYLDILEKWGEYSKYDKNQTSFNLLSNTYSLHKIGNLIGMLLSEYDQTGMLSVIYAKIQFENLLKETKITVWDVITNPDKYKEELQMHEIFANETAIRTEDEFIEKLNNIYLKVTKGKLIGKDDGQRKQLLGSIEKVVESINKCNIDLFVKKGSIGDIQNISTDLYVFETLAECLLTIENSNDGIYLCFIAAGNSADCFFGFFLKSNGTIISINDRIDEAYIGQHGNQRNGRWTEGKVDKIFPYDYIFEYSQHDSKGYATKYTINNEKIDLYNLGIDVYMPIVISMLLIILKYNNKEINLPIHYLDSFLPQNQNKIESYSLMKIGKSDIVCQHNQIDMYFDNNRIITGEYAEEFNWKENSYYKETGVFSNNNQIMVDLWGDGFEFNDREIFTSNNIACLIDRSSDYVPEFVGTEKRVRLQIYKEARVQLANYINEKIYNEWISYGKTEVVKQWYIKSLLNNTEFLYRIFIKYEDTILNGEKKPSLGWKIPNEINIYQIEGKNYPEGAMLDCDDIVNCKRKNNHEWQWLDSVNKCICNTWFIVCPETWKDIEYITGQEVPPIIKGWKVDGHGTKGNSILSVTDAVETIKTPFEYRNQEYNDKYFKSFYDFKFAFGFSKSGWNKIKKQFRS